jgi:hypothetical protein
MKVGDIVEHKHNGTIGVVTHISCWPPDVVVDWVVGTKIQLGSRWTQDTELHKIGEVEDEP